MLLVPQKVSLVNQTKAVILEGISTNRWKHVLPGERPLSLELRVSRWTLREALAELARTGAIKIVHGLPCAIVPQKIKKRGLRQSLLRVALITPSPLSQLRLFVVLWIDELRTILQENGIVLSIINSQPIYRSKPAVGLRFLIKTHPHSAWLLLLSTRPMQEWFSSRSLPAVIAGSRYEDVKLPALDIDCYAAGVHSGHTVYAVGHRRIGLLAPLDATAGIQAGESGVKAALGQKDQELASLVVVRYHNTIEDICRGVERLLSLPHPPSVLIASRASAALTAFSYCSQRGLRIPQDISLVALEWEPFLDYVTPQIARYELSPQQYAKRTAQSLLQCLEMASYSEEVFLEPIFVRGGSLGSRK